MSEDIYPRPWRGGGIVQAMKDLFVSSTIHAMRNIRPSVTGGKGEVVESLGGKRAEEVRLPARCAIAVEGFAQAEPANHRLMRS